VLIIVTIIFYLFTAVNSYCGDEDSTTSHVSNRK
jgi:hypothetical protein